MITNGQYSIRVVRYSCSSRFAASIVKCPLSITSSKCVGATAGLFSSILASDTVALRERARSRSNFASSKSILLSLLSLGLGTAVVLRPCWKWQSFPKRSQLFRVRIFWTSHGESHQAQTGRSSLWWRSECIGSLLEHSSDRSVQSHWSGEMAWCGHSFSSIARPSHQL